MLMLYVLNILHFISRRDAYTLSVELIDCLLVFSLFISPISDSLELIFSNF